MDSGRKSKSNINDENVCPSKRLKTWKLLNDDEDPEILQKMGIGMLESDESSSSTSSVTPSAEVLQQICPSHNNNNNNNNNNDEKEIDLKRSYPTIGNAALNIDNSETDNGTFINPNETMIPCNYKIINNNNSNNNTTIEIYTDKIAERIQKKPLLNIHTKGRSPLTIVSCNNNINNINQNNSIDTTTIKKQTFISDENFHLYRNRLTADQMIFFGKDYFKNLSDEMILHIFKWLPKKTLIRCSYVCRRFNQLTQDESLWTRLDLGCKTLRSGAIGKIVLRGVVILRLAQAEMAHPVFELDSLESLPEYQTKLQYLDLSMSVITKPSLKMLLSKCKQLKKLSLEHVKLNDDICNEIAKNSNLEALNLAMCEGIECWSIKNILIELKQLHSLNISWTSLSVESINTLVDNITTNLLRLNIAGCRKSMFDSHLAILAKRCPGLLELDLSDCTALTSDAISLVCKFKDLEYLSLSRCYSITASSYMDLKNLPSLAFLDVFGLLSDTALTMLQNTFPTVGINKFIHSSVARPTVGTRRTSIWGLRTRD